MGDDGKMLLLMYCFTLIVGFIFGQDYFEDRHTPKYLTQTLRLKEIPKRFEIKSPNAKMQFEKYIDNIEYLALRDNMTVTYRVKVIVTKPSRKYFKKNLVKKMKKYNIPLKKKSMKLSNFEIAIRKMAEEKDQYNLKADAEPTTTVYATFASKMPPLFKFKPIISRVRTNYTKIVKPVKNREITLKVSPVPFL